MAEGADHGIPPSVDPVVEVSGASAPTASIRLQRLIARDFRNLEPLDLDLDAPFVVLHGANAQGKTNVLESIWYAATLKPLRTRRPRELVRWGADDLAIGAFTECDGIVNQRRVELKEGRRTVQLDGKPVVALRSYFEEFRAICFTPADGEIITGGPDLRRKWLDRAAFTARPAHLELVRAYARALANKGALLRSDRGVDHTLLDTYDAQLANLGARLVDQRARLLTQLSPHVDAMYTELCDEDGHVELDLRTGAVGQTVEERTEALAALFAKSREVELRRRRTMSGPQTDDVAVRLGDRPARRYASRGQVRSLVLSLKLAELLAARERGRVPMFLLDDLSSELDRNRTHRLVGLLGDLGAQVIATTTDPDHIDPGSAHDVRRIAVRGGALSVDSEA